MKQLNVQSLSIFPFLFFFSLWSLLSDLSFNSIRHARRLAKLRSSNKVRSDWKWSRFFSIEAHFLPLLYDHSSHIVFHSTNNFHRNRFISPILFRQSCVGCLVSVDSDWKEFLDWIEKKLFEKMSILQLVYSFEREKHHTNFCSHSKAATIESFFHFSWHAIFCQRKTKSLCVNVYM